MQPINKRTQCCNYYFLLLLYTKRVLNNKSNAIIITLRTKTKIYKKETKQNEIFIVGLSQLHHDSKKFEKYRCVKKSYVQK